MSDYKYIGKNLPNNQIYGKVTGQAVYTGDMAEFRTLRMKVKHSTIAHGYIKSIDVSRALEVPGVRAIYTCFNTPEKAYDRGRVSPVEGGFFQEVMFSKHIRYMGERVAAVVADTVAHAEKACELIDVEYDEIPGVYSVEQAIAEGAPLVHEGGNVVEMEPILVGNYEAVKTSHVHKSVTHISRMAHMCMETHTARAKYSKAESKLTVWTGTQTVFGIRSTLGDFLDMPYSRIRVIKPLMGGSFGCKQETIIEPLVAYAAVDLGADVILANTREEQVNDTMMKHNMDFEVESKMDSQGRILGMKIRILLDAGAYMTVSAGYLATIAEKAGKVYRIPNLQIEGAAVYTNTSITGSYRSWGSSEIALAFENHLTEIARELGMDQRKIRELNVHDPHDTDLVIGISIGKTHFQEIITDGSRRFGWDELRDYCNRMNAGGGRYRYGIGMSLASHTSSCYPYHIDISGVVMRVQEDGSVIVHTTVHDHGAGSVIALKKIAAETLGIDVEQITLTEADTENDSYDYGCFASRTTYVIGEAVRQASLDMIDYVRKIAAEMCGCSIQQAKYENGSFTIPANAETGASSEGLSITPANAETGSSSEGVSITPANAETGSSSDGALQPCRIVTFKDIAHYCLTTAYTDLFVHTEIKSKQNPGADCGHYCLAKVDTLTGHVKIEKCLSVHDVGKVINPDLCVGQVASGVQQGIGIAICEELPINPKTGETLVTNFKDYHIANAVEMPDIDMMFIEDGDDYGPYGARSLGEAGLAPVAPAVVAAINDALGTNLTHLPLTPSVIMDALWH